MPDNLTFEGISDIKDLLNATYEAVALSKGVDGLIVARR
jgi:hypothetical protein